MSGTDSSGRQVNNKDTAYMMFLFIVPSFAPFYRVGVVAELKSHSI